MEILDRIIEQENNAQQLKAEAMEKARDILTKAEHEAEAAVKASAASFREQRLSIIEEARKKAELQSKELIEQSAREDRLLEERTEALLDGCAKQIAAEVVGL